MMAIIVSSSKYLTLYYVATACFIFRSRPITEALVVDHRPATAAAPTCSNTHSQRRRNFLSSVAVLLASTAPPTVAADASPSNSDSDSESSSLCRPPTKKLLKTLSDTRSQIDMAVQASSVQAFDSAAEFVNDKLLDSSSLGVLFADSCNNNNQQPSGGDVVPVILQSIERMRSKLNSGSSLTTEDAMDVMRYGTTARSSMDSIFAL